MRFNSHIDKMQGYATAEKFAYEVGVMSNENNYGPSPRVYQAVRSLNDVNRYPDPLATKLREALAKYNGVKPENIVCFSGGDEAIRTILGLFLSSAATLAGHAPTFSMYPIGAQYYGAKYEAVPLEQDFSFTQKQADELLLKKADAIALCNPNNPTGNVIPEQLLKKILDQSSAPVIVDEAYHEYSGQSVKDDAIKGKAIIIRTLSKAWGLAGLRCGYTIASPQASDVLLKAKLTFNVSLVAQAAGIAALSDEKHMRGIVAKVRLDRQQLFDALNASGHKAYPSSANFVLCQDPGLKLYNKLLAGKVLARSFKLPGFGPGEFTRISVGTSQENERVISIIKADSQ